MISLPGRRIRYAPRLLTLAAAIFCILPATAASAAPQTATRANLNCNIVLTVDLHPGLTLEPRLQIVGTRGLNGTAVCTGTVNGKPVTGPGHFGDALQGVGSCGRVTFTGFFLLTIPTAAGIQTLIGQFTETGVAPLPAVLTGNLAGSVVSGIPIEGDCVNTPLTRAQPVLAGTITI